MVEVRFSLVKRDFVWIGLIVVLLAVGFGYAFNSGLSPDVMGHSAGEIDTGCGAGEFLDGIGACISASEIAALAEGGQIFSGAGSTTQTLDLPAGNWVVSGSYNAWPPWTITFANVNFRFNEEVVYNKVLTTARDHSNDHASDSATFFYRKEVVGPISVTADITGDLTSLTDKNVMIFAYNE